MNQPESATIWATIENSSHPEYGVVMIPFSIPRESYDSYMGKLQAMEIGDPLKRDCRVVSILSDYSGLKPLEIMTVNTIRQGYRDCGMDGTVLELAIEKSVELAQHRLVRGEMEMG